MSSNWCIIIQGPSQHVEIIKTKWQSTLPIIFSTSDNEQHHYTPDDVVVYNKLPQEKGKQNVMCQQMTTENGLLKARSLGFKNAIKIRSDQYFTNPTLFISYLTAPDFDITKLYFLYCYDYIRKDHANRHYTYLVDYIQIGSISNLLKMWNFKYDIHCEYPEQLITRHVAQTFANTDISFFGDKITSECDIYWLGRNILLSQYSKQVYKTYIPSQQYI